MKCTFAWFHMQKSLFSQRAQVSKPFFLHTYLNTAPASWNMTKQCSRHDGECGSAGTMVAVMLGGLATQLSERQLNHFGDEFSLSEDESLPGAKFRSKRVHLEAESHQKQLSLHRSGEAVHNWSRCPNCVVYNNDNRGDFDFHILVMFGFPIAEP